MTAAALTHPRQHPEAQAQGAEVVDLHGAFEIVKTIIGVFNRAANRAARVVDQHVNLTVIGNDLGDKSVAGLHVRGVALVDMRFAADGLNLALGVLQGLQGTTAQYHFGAGLSQANGRGQANARTAAGNDDHLAFHIALQGVVDKQLGVEIALPVVPQARGIACQFGHSDTAAL